MISNVGFTRTIAQEIDLRTMGLELKHAMCSKRDAMGVRRMARRAGIDRTSQVSGLLRMSMSERPTDSFPDVSKLRVWFASAASSETIGDIQKQCWQSTATLSGGALTAVA